MKILKIFHLKTNLEKHACKNVVTMEASMSLFIPKQFAGQVKAAI